MNFALLYLLFTSTFYSFCLSDDFPSNTRKKVRYGHLRSKINESLGDSVIDFDLNELNRVYHSGKVNCFDNL